MGLRFRKRIRILPDIWFNLSKSGISTSIRGKGLTVNLKNSKTKTTVGIFRSFIFPTLGKLVSASPDFIPA